VMSRIKEFYPVIEHLALQERQIPLGNGAFSFKSPSYEERLSTILNLKALCKVIDWNPLIESTFIKILEEWKTDLPNPQEALELRKKFISISKETGENFDKQISAIKSALLTNLDDIYAMEDFADIFGLLTTTEQQSQALLTTLTTAFEDWARYNLSNHIRDCNSFEEYDTLLEAASDIGTMLSLDVTDIVSQIDDARGEFLDYQEGYADHHSDALKEARSEAKYEENEISAMFETLKE